MQLHENVFPKAIWTVQARGWACHQHYIVSTLQTEGETKYSVIGDRFELVLIWLVKSHKATIEYRDYRQLKLWSIKSELLVYQEVPTRTLIFKVFSPLTFLPCYSSWWHIEALLLFSYYATNLDKSICFYYLGACN